ncbi:nuclear transport factor 2 family protein [Micromonospora sp. NPDC048935]|uniref:nuclear transport factor 2 family protein n=1 Tax=Micromonospora sp. NPDC048935 TaxID=3364262 RepID=UPI00371BCDBD
MRATHRRLAATAAALLLPAPLVGCGMVDDARDGAKEELPPATPTRTPADEAASRSRERVQAYLDAMIAKDVAAGRSQLCALLHESFDQAATGPNGDFADHFQVPQAAITDVRSGPLGQEVSVSVSVAANGRTVVRPLVFTVTRDGGDWCIAGEMPGGRPATPTPTPTGLFVPGQPGQPSAN